MSDSTALPVLATLPVLAVEPGHIAEARRALTAQGRTLSDTATERLLWTARALPAALDALADVRSPLALADARFTAVSIELGDAPTSQATPLLLRARAHATGVEVEVIELFAYLDNGEVRVRCRILLTVSPAPPSEGVRVVRFQVS